MKKAYLTIFFLALAVGVFAQSTSGKAFITWTNNVQDLNNNLEKVDQPYFEGVFYDNLLSCPQYIITYKNKSPIKDGEINLYNEEFEPLTESDYNFIKKANLSKNYKVEKIIKQSGRDNFITFLIPAFIFNPTTLQWQKIKRFDYNISTSNNSDIVADEFFFRSGTTSPLNEGTWYKIGVTSTGIQKLTKDFFTNNNINITGVNPKNIRVFGYAQGMLPESISEYTPASLTEIKGYFEGETDNSFDNGDHLLFFATGANVWDYNTTTQIHEHKKHLYSDTAYYLLNIGNIPAQRIETANLPTGLANAEIKSYPWHQFYEVDQTNLIKTGRDWYGDYFNFTSKRNYSFTIPELYQSEKIHFKAKLAIRSTLSPNNNVYFRANNSLIHSKLNISNVSTSYTSNYAVLITEKDSFNISGNNLSFQIEYTSPTTGSEAWLDYLEIHAKSKLKLTGTSLLFDNDQNIGIGKLSNFKISDINSSTQIWNVTNPYNAEIIPYSLKEDTGNFTFQTDSAGTFIAFNPTGTKSPFVSGKISNQNLTGLTDVDYILITPNALKSSTEKLANYHQINSNLTTAVVTIDQVYNEFSGGTPDITAIRNFCKYLYENASSPTSRIKYLFLMGDGSYDPKNRELNNLNYIPTFQSNNSVSPTASFVSDDYFAMLDDAGGIYSAGSAVDIGIGRFPARNSTDAAGFVDKAIHYMNSSKTKNVGTNTDIRSTHGNWKNKMLFVADDGSTSDGYTSAHVTQTEMIIDAILAEDSSFNVNKVYLDSYVKNSTAGGGRYPDVNREIHEAMQGGVFFVSYIGHGGEVGWADERILDIEEITSWDNMDAMPLFLTATCEFSRYDDPARTSAGEYTILNSKGGAIAMITTTRLVYGGITNNIGFSINFFQQGLNEYNGSMPRLGDVIRLTKTVSPLGSNYNNRKFALLGDPAMKLAYPKYSVATTKINGVNISSSPDTLKALSLIKIEGEIRDENNAIINLNGYVYPTVYDKLNQLTTLDNNNANSVVNFENRNNILYSGLASVTDGKFSFEFIVPKDINYSYGKGRISYYFTNDTIDGKGYNEQITVGGSSSNLNSDLEGPQLQLFMNDTNFIFGGTTTSSPDIYAVVNDLSGINTTGNSLGHDITAVLDDDYANPIILNDYYESTLDDYQNGKVTYPLSNIADGKHNLRLKIWDVNNNSSEAYTEFIVANEADLALNYVLNYPNPFTTSTNFFFEHNQPNQDLEVLIKIYTISGKLIKSIPTQINSNGNLKSNPIHWDGLDDFGDRIGRGVYIYQVSVSSPDGKSAEKIEKLVILQ